MMKSVFIVITIMLGTAAEDPTPPPGLRVKLPTEGAAIFIPEGYKPGGNRVNIVLHLHGTPRILEPALVATTWPAILVSFNRPGLSSVYTKPFSDAAFLDQLLDQTMQAVKEAGLAQEPRPGRLVVSSFSAGFGGVRELLKVPGHFERIDALIMCDSIYAGYAGDPARKQVDPALMAGFVAFAQQASEGKKTFLLTHSAQVPEGYASTTETADHLIATLGGRAEPKEADWGNGWRQTRVYERGGFRVLGFAGTEGADHMSHLRQIGSIWKAAGNPFAPRAGEAERERVRSVPGVREQGLVQVDRSRDGDVGSLELVEVGRIAALEELEPLFVAGRGRHAGHHVRVADHAQLMPADDERSPLIDAEAHQARVPRQEAEQPLDAVPLHEVLVDDRVGQQVEPPALGGLGPAAGDHDARHGRCARRAAADHAPALQQALELALDFGADIDVRQHLLPAAAQPDAGGFRQGLQERRVVGRLARPRVQQVDRRNAERLPDFECVGCLARVGRRMGRRDHNNFGARASGQLDEPAPHFIGQTAAATNDERSAFAARIPQDWSWIAGSGQHRKVANQVGHNAHPEYRNPGQNDPNRPIHAALREPAHLPTRHPAPSRRGSKTVPEVLQSS